MSRDWLLTLAFFWIAVIISGNYRSMDTLQKKSERKTSIARHFSLSGNPPQSRFSTRRICSREQRKKATWLAGDKHWRHHQPITFPFCCSTNYPPAKIIVKCFHLSSNWYFEKAPNCVTRPASSLHGGEKIYGVQIAVWNAYRKTSFCPLFYHVIYVSLVSLRPGQSLL